MRFTISPVETSHKVIESAFWLLLAAVLGIGSATGCAREGTALDWPQVSATALPAEVSAALRRIDAGGPFPYKKDGAVFFNREELLPKAPRGYYREYTVETPDSQDRGPRRIVQGRNGELYYTDDHYRTFKRVMR
jgi:ribonuclease T1